MARREVSCDWLILCETYSRDERRQVCLNGLLDFVALPDGAHVSTFERFFAVAKFGPGPLPGPLMLNVYGPGGKLIAELPSSAPPRTADDDSVIVVWDIRGFPIAKGTYRFDLGIGIRHLRTASFGVRSRTR